MNIKKNKYLQIGLMVIAALISFIWGYNFLRGRNILKPSNQYYITYPEISGLMESDAVLIRGLKVGQVNAIMFDAQHPEDILVKIVIDKNISIPKDSRLVLSSVSLMGTKGIVMEIGNTTRYYSSGDTIKGHTEIDLLNKFNDEIGPIKEKSELILDRVDTITGSVNKALSEDMIRNLHLIIKNLQLVSGEIAAGKHAINETIENINLITARLAEERETLAAIMQNIKEITNPEAYAQIMAELEGTMGNLNTLTASLNNEEGTLHKLMTDAELYNNLSSVSNSADDLLRDMKNYPGRYVQFSLFNNGKSIYLDKEGVMKKLADEKDLDFRILVKKTENAIAIDETNFVDPTQISEFKHKGTYYYYAGEYKLYTEVDAALERVSNDYPDAKILVLKKGKPVPIDKVLK